MPPSNISAARVDPYKNFKFRVKWDGAYVAGISKISPLKRTTEVVKHRDGGDPGTSHKSPGRTEYEAITLERGVTHDPAFQQWASKVWDYQNAQSQNADQEVSLPDVRKDVIIDVFNEAGQKAISYRVYRCWVSEYEALPDLDANDNAVTIKRLRLENEGWDRDPAVVEPAEPSLRLGSAKSPGCQAAPPGLWITSRVTHRPIVAGSGACRPVRTLAE